MNPEPGEFALSMWLIGTIGHFGLTAYWVRRFHLAGSSRDEFWFVSMLTATGTLALVLHMVAASVGLGLASVLVPLAAVHGVLAAIASRRPRSSQSIRPAGPMREVSALTGAATQGWCRD